MHLFGMFKAALMWVMHAPESRMKELLNMMKNIKFGLMTTQELVEGVGKESVILSNSDCYKMWLKAVSYQSADHIYDQPFLCDTWNQPCCEWRYLLVLSRTSK